MPHLIVEYSRNLAGFPEAQALTVKLNELVTIMASIRSEGDTLRAVVGPRDKAMPEKLTDPAPGTRGFTLKRDKK